MTVSTSGGIWMADSGVSAGDNGTSEVDTDR
jgi:hypothetical protein